MQLTRAHFNAYTRALKPTPRETDMQPSDYLYARPSFAEGVARIMDFGNTLGVYNASGARGDADPDRAALRKDWEVIGGDFRHAVAEFTAEESDRLAAADNTASEG